MYVDEALIATSCHGKIGDSEKTKASKHLTRGNRRRSIDGRNFAFGSIGEWTSCPCVVRDSQLAGTIFHAGKSARSRGRLRERIGW
jgi:hypothetical protein